MVRAAALLIGLLAAGPAAACRLALVLALDVSASVDMAEDALQRGGLAAALTSPAVRGALLSEPGDPVHLAAFEWSGPDSQAAILPWTMLDSGAAVDRAAAQIAASPRRFTEEPTAMGRALSHAALLLDAGPPCRRRVIDVSGDGVNNESYGPGPAYRHFPFRGVTVNGLAIGGAGSAVVGFYRSEVLHGPGAFLEQTGDFSGFARAMEAKLLREIGGPALSALPADGGRLRRAGHRIVHPAAAKVNLITSSGSDIIRATGPHPDPR